MLDAQCVMSSLDSHGDSAVKRLNPPMPSGKGNLECIPISSKMANKPGSDPTRTLRAKPSEPLLSINWPPLHPPIILPGTDQGQSPTVNLKILKNKKYKTSQVELYLRQDHSSQHDLSQQNHQILAGQQRLKLGDFLLSDTAMSIDINSQYIYGCQVTFDRFVSSKVTSTTTTSRFILKDMREQFHRMHIRGIREAAACDEVNYERISCKPEAKKLNDEKGRAAITCDGDCRSEQKSGTANGNKSDRTTNEVVPKRATCPIPKPRLKTAVQRQRTTSMDDVTCQSKCKDGNEKHSCTCRKSSKTGDTHRGASEKVGKTLYSSHVRAKHDVERCAAPIVKKKHELIPKCENTGAKSCTFKSEPDNNRSGLKDDQKKSQLVDKCGIRNQNACSISRRNNIVSTSPGNRDSGKVCPLEDYHDKRNTITANDRICITVRNENHTEYKTDPRAKNQIETQCSCKHRYGTSTSSCFDGDKNVDSVPSQNTQNSHKDQLCSCEGIDSSDKVNSSTCSCKTCNEERTSSSSVTEMRKNSSCGSKQKHAILNGRDTKKPCLLKYKASVRVLLPHDSQHKDEKIRPTVKCVGNEGIDDRKRTEKGNVECEHSESRCAECKNRLVDNKCNKNRCIGCQEVLNHDVSRVKKKRPGSFFECLDSDPISTKKTNTDYCAGKRSKLSEKEPLCCNSSPLETIVEKSNDSKCSLLPPPPAKGILKRTSSSVDKYVSAQSSQSHLSQDEEEDDCLSKQRRIEKRTRNVESKPPVKLEKSREKSSGKAKCQKSVKLDPTLSLKNKAVGGNVFDSSSKESEDHESKHFIQHLLDLIRSFNGDKKESPKSSGDEQTDKPCANSRDLDRRRKSSRDAWTNVSNAKVYEYESGGNGNSKIKVLKYVENDASTEPSAESRDSNRKKKSSFDGKRRKNVVNSSSQTSKCDHTECEHGSYKKAASSSKTQQDRKCKQKFRSKNERASQDRKQDASKSKERKDSCEKYKTQNNKSEDSKTKSKPKESTPKCKEPPRARRSQSTTSSESSDYTSTSSRSKCSSCDSSHSQTIKSSVCDTCKCVPTSQSNMSTCSCHLHMRVYNTLTPQSSVSSRISQKLISPCDEKTSSDTQSPKEDERQCKQNKSKLNEAQKIKSDERKEKKEIHSEDNKHNMVRRVKQNILCVDRKDSFSEYGSSHSITISACSSEIYSFLGNNDVMETLCSDCIKNSVDDIREYKDDQKRNKDDEAREKGKKELCTNKVEEPSTESELDSCTKSNKVNGNSSKTRGSRATDVCEKLSSEKEGKFECNDGDSSKNLVTCEKNQKESKRDDKEDGKFSKGKEKCAENVRQVERTNKIPKTRDQIECDLKQNHERTNKIPKTREQIECDLKQNHEFRQDKCEGDGMDENKRKHYRPEIQEQCNNELKENDVNQCLIKEECPKIPITIEKYENNTCNENPTGIIKEKLENNEKPVISKHTQNDSITKSEVIKPKETSEDTKVSIAKLKFEEKIQKTRCQPSKCPCKKSPERPMSCNSCAKNTEESKHIQFLQEIKNVHDKIMANKCTNETNSKCPDECVSTKKNLDAFGGNDNQEKCINRIANGDVEKEPTKTSNALSQPGGDSKENKFTTKKVQTEKCVGFILGQIEQINQDDDDVMPKRKPSNKFESCDKHVTFIDDVLSEKNRTVQNEREYTDRGERTCPKENACSENKSDSSIPPESRRRRVSNRRSEKWIEGVLDICNLKKQRSTQKCVRLFDINLDCEESERKHRKNSPSVGKEKRKSKSRSKSLSNRSQRTRSKDDVERNDASSRTSIKRAEDKDAKKRDHRKSDHRVSADQFLMFESKSCHRLEVKDSGKQPFAATNHSRVSRTEVCYFTSSQKKITSEQRFSQDKIASEQGFTQNTHQNYSQKKISSEQRFSQNKIASEQRFCHNTHQNNSQKKVNSEQRFSQNNNEKSQKNIKSQERSSKYPTLDKTNGALPSNQALGKEKRSLRKRSPKKSDKKQTISKEGESCAQSGTLDDRIKSSKARTNPVPHVSSKTKFTSTTIEPSADLSDSEDGDSEIINEAFDKVYTELESYFNNKQNMSDTLAHLSLIEKLTDKILNKEGLADQPLEMNFNSSSYTEYLLGQSLDEMGQFEENFESFLARKQMRCYHTFNQDLTEEGSSVGTAVSRLQSAQTTRVWSRQAIRCNRVCINFEDESTTCEPNLPLSRNVSYLHHQWKPKH